MKLADLSADQILQELERRSDVLKEVDTKVAELEGAFKAFEASSALAFKKSGDAMNVAEKRVRELPAWSEAYRELQAAIVEQAEARRSYRRAEHALDLWRTEKSTERAFSK